MIVVSVRAGRLAVDPAGAALEARRPGRPRPHPVLSRFAARDGESRFWGAVVSTVLRRPLVSRPAGRGRAARARPPGARACTRSCRASPTCPQYLPIDQDLRGRSRRRSRALRRRPRSSSRRRDVRAPQVVAAGAELSRRALATPDRSCQPIGDSQPGRTPSRGSTSRSSATATDARSDRALQMLRGDADPADARHGPGRRDRRDREPPARTTSTTR